MTGDAEELVEKEILKSNQDIKATILKVGHHGSKTASSKQFINAIEPTYALISCGLNNKYNHPSKEVLERLNKKKIKTYRTDNMGNVILRITEQDVEISLEKLWSRGEMSPLLKFYGIIKKYRYLNTFMIIFYIIIIKGEEKWKKKQSITNVQYVKI